MKRGVSPLIGAVLLISLSLALAGIYFVWMRGSVSNLTAEKIGEALCRDVVFKATDMCFNAAGKILQFNAINNVNTTLNGFSLSIEYEGTSMTISAPGELKSFAVGEFTSEVFNPAGTIERVSISPMIASGGKLTVCKEQETIVNNIENC
jgi:FlaG/FlaF family flagellin (archaellin)